MIVLIILKIILIILLVVIGLIFLALIMPMSVYVSYIDEKVCYKVKYAFILFIASDKKSGLIYKLNKLKRKKNKKSKKKSEPKSEVKSEIKSEPQSEPKSEPAPETNEKVTSDVHSDNNEKTGNEPIKEKSHKRPFLERVFEFFEKVSEIWEMSSKPLKRFCKGIHFDGIYIDFKISDADACDCALKYGRTCMFVYNVLGIFDKIFTLTKKSIDVNCIFNEEKSIYDMGVTVKLKPITALVSALSFMLKYKSYQQNNQMKNSRRNNNGK